VTNEAAKPDYILPIGDDGSMYEDHSSGELIVMIINETKVALMEAGVMSKIRTPAIPR
jgi:hypothetical protein